MNELERDVIERINIWLSALPESKKPNPMEYNELLLVLGLDVEIFISNKKSSDNTSYYSLYKLREKSLIDGKEVYVEMDMQPEIIHQEYITCEEHEDKFYPV